MLDTSQSTADLIRQATDQVSTLVRDEIRLARAELAEKGRHAGLGVGLFGGAAVTLHFAVAALLVAAGFALALVMPGWAAALVIAAVLFVVAAAQAWLGRREIQRTAPLAPTRAMNSVRSDVDALSTAVEERNRR